MLKPSFHIAFQEARAQRKLTLAVLSELTGIGETRLYRLEVGTRRPKPEERQRLAMILTEVGWELRTGCARPPHNFRTLKKRARCLTKPPEPFFPPYDRHCRFRLGSCGRDYPEATGRLLRQLDGRNDIEELSHFCDDLSVGSGLECLFLLSLLARGACPGFRQPDSLARTPKVIGCPETRSPVGLRPFPCLILDGCGWFLQVSFLTPRLYTVDFLRFKGGEWSVVEIDGPGHIGRRDSERTQAIGLPTRRLVERDVLKFVEESLNRGRAA